MTADLAWQMWPQRGMAIYDDDRFIHALQGTAEDAGS
jgi:hypothetical protein